MTNSILQPASKNLENAIRMAMNKIHCEKETDLCQSIPHLTPTTYFMLKNNDPDGLIKLIYENILTNTESKDSEDDPRDLKAIIHQAVTVTKVSKETELAHYIPDGEVHMHHLTFLRIKKDDPLRLLYLIKQNILDKPPHKYPVRPRKVYRVRESTSNALNETLDICMEKLGNRITKEEDLCRYIPHHTGFLHPMSYRALKIKNPAQLTRLLREHVLEPSNPKRLLWHNATPTSEDMPQSQKVARSCKETTTEQCPVAKTPTGHSTRQAAQPSVPKHHKPTPHNKLLQAVQNQLISSIFHLNADQELWEVYSDLILASQKISRA